MRRNTLFVRIIILMVLLCYVSNAIMGQKVNLDSLSTDHRNLYLDKAIKMRNTGRVLTLSGGGVMVTSIIIGMIALSSDHNSPSDCKCGPPPGLFYVGLVGTVGMATMIVGIPLWAVGGGRKAKAELSLQKYNIPHEKSKAVGLALTIYF
jgi:hypothetical protein